jgi:1-deoxy-D-xylulose-5-phosphate synthase
LVGGDGATHQGIFDMAYLRALPNMSIAMPKDTNELQALLKTALSQPGPKAIRWPRGKTAAPKARTVDTWDNVAWGSWEVLKEGTEATILAIGPTIEHALAAAQGLPNVGVVNARFIKPLDEAMLTDLAQSRLLITVEDHVRHGGLGSAVAETLKDLGLEVPLVRLGLPDSVIPHGNPAAQYSEFGIDAKGIRRSLAQAGIDATVNVTEASVSS